jgi:hypothetical protein
MTTKLKKWAWATGLSALLVLLLGAVSSLPRGHSAGAVLLPGLLAAGILFPQGVHSGWALLYGVTAALADVLIFAWLGLLAWRALVHLRKKL